MWWTRAENATPTDDGSDRTPQLLRWSPRGNWPNSSGCRISSNSAALRMNVWRNNSCHQANPSRQPNCLRHETGGGHVGSSTPTLRNTGLTEISLMMNVWRNNSCHQANPSRQPNCLRHETGGGHVGSSTPTLRNTGLTEISSMRTAVLAKRSVTGESGVDGTYPPPRHGFTDQSREVRSTSTGRLTTTHFVAGRLVGHTTPTASTHPRAVCRPSPPLWI